MATSRTFTVKGIPFDLAPLTIICGHYGVGKTNLSLNLAYDAALSGYDVTLVDLDIVNPYFRSSEHETELKSKGVSIVGPTMANSSLDTPSLSASILGAIQAISDNPNALVIVDVGGDDVGATALGRYTDAILSTDYALYYVVNNLRNLTQTPKDACEILSLIQEVSGLIVSGVISNAHLKQDTTFNTIIDGALFLEEVSRLLECPALCVTAPKLLLEQNNSDVQACELPPNVYPVNMYVKVPWE